MFRVVTLALGSYTPGFKSYLSLARCVFQEKLPTPFRSFFLCKMGASMNSYTLGRGVLADNHIAGT